MQKVNDSKYYKKDYCITFYDATDELYIASFDNVKQICIYKNKEVTAINLNLISVELNRALKRSEKTTRMLDGSLMHIHLMNIKDEEE